MINPFFLHTDKESVFIDTLP